MKTKLPYFKDILIAIFSSKRFCKLDVKTQRKIEAIAYKFEVIGTYIGFAILIEACLYLVYKLIMF